MHGVRNKIKVALLNVMLGDKVPKISAGKAAKQTDALFLDTRTEQEFNVSHIKGARFVGYQHFDLSSLTDVSKQQPIIVYCAVGKRSDTIGEKLMTSGFTNVVNLYGGIFEWFNQGYPVVDLEGLPTQSIHTYSAFFSWWVKRGNKVH